MSLTKAKPTKKQLLFILEDVCVLAWGASVQHAKIYNSDVDLNDPRRNTFRLAMLEYVTKNLLPKYENLCSPADHLKNLEALVKEGNRFGADILDGNVYRLGIVQKLLNLILKYWWCLDLIKEPPHCPVDRIVMDKTRLKGKVTWTTMTQLDEYSKAIAAIREMAEKNGLSIAGWELKEWKRRKPVFEQCH